MSNSTILPVISDNKGNVIKIPNSARILSSPLDGNNDNLGCIVSDYANKRDGRNPHYGIDFRAQYGTPVYASTSGTVAFSANNKTSLYGETVVLEHDIGDGSVGTLYAHLSERAVEYGDTVQEGDLIGYSRQSYSGGTAQPHLHYEVVSQNTLEQMQKAGRDYANGLNPDGRLYTNGTSGRLDPFNFFNQQTVDSLNKCSNKNPKRYFIWRTSGGDNVCDGCAALDGQVFEMYSGLQPGSVHENCGCYAEFITENDAKSF